MTSTTLKTADAKGAMRLWMAALCITYAVVLLQTYHLIAGSLHDGRLAPFAARIGLPAGFEKTSVQKLSLLEKPLSTQQRNVTLASLVLAIFLIGYLHLKLSVPAGQRNRLWALKGRATTEQDEKTTFEHRRQEQEILGKLLVASGALSAEELLQGLDLSKATHRLLGECFVSFNWISGEGLTTALEIMGNLRAGGINDVEAVQEQLRDLRLTQEQVAAKLAQQQEAPNAVSLARHDYKILLAKSKEKKATKARAALELAQMEEAGCQSANRDDAGSELTGSELTGGDEASREQRRATVPIEVEHRHNQVVCSPETSVAVARSIDAHQQNDDTRALLKRMNEADEMYALFKAEPRRSSKPSKR